MFALVPGTVAVAVPALMTRYRMRPALLGLGPLRLVGAAMIAAGAPLLVRSFVRFVRQGRGTPAPLAPPERLVASGPYRFVRNPMYEAVVAVAAGQGLLFGSVAVLVYAGVLVATFHLFVTLYEEPYLRSQFGPDYEAYCQRVGRWLPRRT